MSDVTIRQLKAFSVPTNTPANAVMSDGTKYYGDIRPHDGAPHGKGYAYLADGSRYGGEWRDGKFHGSGAMITDSYEYEGLWEYGRMHGLGTMLYKDSVFSSVMHGIASITPFEQKHRPLEYRGEFHRVHHRHGKGTMIYRNGDCYEGEWNANQRDGCGTMRFENGEKYVGFWAKDERSGTGTMTFNDGSIFTGSYIADVRNGHGVLKFPNGDVYDGNFTDDQMEGHGTMCYRNGDVYKGMWKDGIRHGTGEFLLKRSGATITGNFHKGLIQGKGCVCVLPGRSYFKGEYYKGERVRGTCWMVDGSCYDGEWIGDNMSGKGLMWYSNGDFYYGQFQRSKRHGKGCLNIAADGTEYAGEFVQDKWCGVGMRLDRDGNISAGTFGVPSPDGATDANGNIKINKKAVANGSNSVKILPVTKGIPKSAAASPTTAPAITTPTSSDPCPNPANGDNAAAHPNANPTATSAVSRNGSFSSAPPPPPPEPVEAAEVFPLLHGYHGEWDGTSFNGIGNLYLPNGDYFLGLFQGGLRHGVGCMERVLIDANGKEVTSAAFLAAVKSSSAAMASTLTNSTNRGSGGVIANLPQHLKHLSRIPLKTVGRWDRDTLNGIATVRFARGTVYQGQWEDAMRHGHGQFVAEDGTIYNGGWFNDLQSGEGCLFVVNKKEPLYAYPAEDKENGKSAGAGILNTVFSIFSSAAKDSKPAPVLLGYEDLCAVHGRWEIDSGAEGSMQSTTSAPSNSVTNPQLFSGGQSRRDLGKLYSTVTIFFSDVYEKVYQGQWVANRQSIDFPHKLIIEASNGNALEAGGQQQLLTTNEAMPSLDEENVTPLTNPASGVTPPPIDGGGIAGKASSSSVGICTFCHSQFGFFKKESFCTGCQRLSCPSCLLDVYVPQLTKTKSLPPPAPQGGLAPASTVELCAECVACVKQGVVFATQWFTFRRKNPTNFDVPQIKDGALKSATTPSKQSANTAVAVASSSSPTQLLIPSSADDVSSPISPRQNLEYQVYRGYFKEGNIPHGYGVLWRNEEACYSGEFSNGMRHGQGSLVWSNGEEFYGTWANNLPHGVGVYRCNDGTAVEAEWSNGSIKRLRYHGEISANGYERHGTGVAVYSDGTRYNGEWEYNARHGTGLVQYSNGTIYSGQFVHDNQHGLGKIVNSESVFMGEFVGGAKHGVGVLVVGRKTLKGTWNDDVLSGWVRIWNDDASEIIDTLYANDEERTDVFIMNRPQEDEAVSQCPSCKSAFGFFLRRHHCRLCGGVFCDACTKGRAVIPPYFNLGDTPSRVCDRCRTSLKAGSTLAVKRYRDGCVYVGQWSQGRWAGRGIYRSPNGHVANVLSKPPGGASGQSFAATTVLTSGPGLHEDLNIIEDMRGQLMHQRPATQTELDSFSVWWDKIVKGVKQPYAYDFTSYNEIPPPTITLPFEINVFSEYAPTNRKAAGNVPNSGASPVMPPMRPRDLAAAQSRRARYNSNIPKIPPMPEIPWHLKPVRPRKVTEPSEEDVLIALRTERIRGLTHDLNPPMANSATTSVMRSGSENPFNFIGDRSATEYSSVPRGFSMDCSELVMDDDRATAVGARTKIVLNVKTVGDLRQIEREQQREEQQSTPVATERVGGEGDSPQPKPVRSDASATSLTTIPTTAATKADDHITTSTNVCVQQRAIRVNLPTPPIPNKDDANFESLALEWTQWDPTPAPQYKGVASAPGGESIAPRGGINGFYVEGLDSGPLLFNDVPQRFYIAWTAKGAEVTQVDRTADDMGPYELPPLSTSTHEDPNQAVMSFVVEDKKGESLCNVGTESDGAVTTPTLGPFTTEPSPSAAGDRIPLPLPPGSVSPSGSSPFFQSVPGAALSAAFLAAMSSATASSPQFASDVAPKLNTLDYAEEDVGANEDESAIEGNRNSDNSDSDTFVGKLIKKALIKRQVTNTAKSNDFADATSDAGGTPPCAETYNFDASQTADDRSEATPAEDEAVSPATHAPSSVGPNPEALRDDDNLPMMDGVSQQQEQRLASGDEILVPAAPSSAVAFTADEAASQRVLSEADADVGCENKDRVNTDTECPQTDHRVGDAMHMP